MNVEKVFVTNFKIISLYSPGIFMEKNENVCFVCVCDCTSEITYSEYQMSPIRTSI